MPSVSDTATHTETAKALLASLVKPSDSVTSSEVAWSLIWSEVRLAESVTVQIQTALSPSDSSTHTETVVTAIQTAPSPSDTVTTSETITLLVSTPNVVVSDSATHTETSTAAIGATPDLNLSVSDTVTSSESDVAAIQTAIAASDSATHTETTTVTVSTPNAAVSDTVTTSESITVSLPSSGPLSVSVSDGIATSEAVTASIPGPSVSASTSDATTVSEAVRFSNPYDPIDTTETVNLQIVTPGSAPDLNLAVSDLAFITDLPSSSTFSSIRVSEGVNVQIGAPFSPGLAEAVHVADVSTVAVQPNASFSVNVSETVTTAEWNVIAFDPVITWTYELAVSDSTSHTETVHATITAGGVRRLGTIVVTVASVARPAGLRHTNRALGAVTVLGRALRPASLTRTRAQGNPVLSARVVIVGLVHARGLGAPAVNPIRLTGLSHTRGFGTHTVTTVMILRPAGQVHGTRAVGSLTARGRLTLTPIGLAHVRAQGNPILSARLVLTGLVHTRGIGSPEVNLVHVLVLALDRG